MAVPAILAALVAGGLAADLAPGPQGAMVAAARGCRPTPDLLDHRPAVRYRLPGGARVRIWQGRTSPHHLLRVAAVTIPPSRLTPRVVTSPTIARAIPVAGMVRGDGRNLVAINGGHFYARIPGVPTKSQIRAGDFRKGIRAPDKNVAVYSADHQVATARAWLAGSVRSSRGVLDVRALNWQYLAAKGLSVYTHEWGRRPHPTGPRTVVVSGDRVRAVLTGRRGHRQPGPGQHFLTARPGPAARALARLRVGDAAEVSVSPAGSAHIGRAPLRPIGEPTGLLGVGGTVLAAGRNRGICDTRNEMRRPRSLLGWRPDGSMLVVAMAGRGAGRHGAGGGATVHQAVALMHELGAYRAVNFDGGTSTTLLVRRRVGGPLVRLDRPWSRFSPPVVDGLAYRLPDN